MKNSNSKQLTMQQAIAGAKKAIKQGNAPVAVELYKAVLKQQPNHPVAKKKLKELQKEFPTDRSSQALPTNPSKDQIDALVKLYQTGQIANAEQACGRLLELHPKSLPVINLLGAVLQRQRKWQEAIDIYNQAILLKPDFAEAYSNRGNALHQQGKLDEALESYDRAIQIKPDYSIAFFNRGNVLCQLRNLEEGLKSYDKAIELKPDSAEAYSNRGNILGELGELEEALTSYNKASALKSDYVEAHSNRGNILGFLGYLDEAQKSYETAIKLKPSYAQAHSNLGSVLEQTGRLIDAIESYDKAITLKPDFVEAYSNRGNVLAQLGKPDEALENFDKAIRLNPDFVEAHSNRGKVLDEIGRLDDALQSYERAIQLKPDYADAHRSISTLIKYDRQNPHIKIMESLLSNSVLSDQDRMYLYFALAKVYDDLGEYKDSFDYLQKANFLRHQELNYDIDSDKNLFAKIKEVLNSKNLASIDTPDSNTNLRTLFIVGMPRSGTSLVEQILASHSKVHGAGELEVIGRLAFPIISGKFHGGFNQSNARIFTEKIESLHNNYLETLTSLNVRETVFTDKMPNNFIFVGLILSAFPQSKIIHVKRDPIATCWSNYRHFFSGKGNGYAYDMTNLAEFYNLYRDLMAFWHEQFPGMIYELDYESLTENQEEQSRKLLDFCGLDWEKECLYFYKTKRAVRTASSAQVRRKMYKGSSEAWRKYESYLQPLINSLNR